MENLKPKTNPPSVDQVFSIEASWSRQTFQTKSGGRLSVLFQIPEACFPQDYKEYEKYELGKIPVEIRGLRAYRVDGLKENSIGANEFHRVRKEILFAVDGAFEIECEDVYGNRKEFFLEGSKGLFIPPFIFHTYKTKKEGSLLVVANTLFFPGEEKSKDSYGIEIFRGMQQRIKK